MATQLLVFPLGPQDQVSIQVAHGRVERRTIVAPVRSPAELPTRQEVLRFPVASILTWVTCPLRSTGITPLPRYYEAVRPWLAHWYFRPHGSSTCAFSLTIANQVLKFRTKARIRVMPSLRRTPHDQ